jgi:hypothetical protein
MKWIRLSVMCSFLMCSSFLFAHGDHVLLDTIPADKPVKQLPAVVLRRQASQGRLSGDTLVFDAQRYARPSAFRLEELLKDVPGFRVDGEGRIYFNGKEISRIMIDGDDLAGERYRMMSRNLRAVMVDKIEVIQAHQSNRLLRELLQTTSPAINIRLKNEYKGKLSGSASLGLGMKRLRQTEAEAVWMKDKWKEFVFSDHNNNGAKGISERNNEKDGSGASLLYELHPFAFTYSDQQSLITGGQQFRNDDIGFTSMSNFNIHRAVKMNVVLTGSKLNFLQEKSVKRTILQQDTDSLLLIQRINMKRKTDQFLLRAGWDKDEGKDHVVKNILQLGYDQSDHTHAEIRKGAYRYDRNTHDQESQWRMQWDREGTRKMGSGIMLQHKTRLALGNLSIMNRSSTFNFVDSNTAISVHQQWFRKGWLFEDDLRFFMVAKKIRWNWGLRSLIENTFTSIVRKDHDYYMFKSFPYAELSWKPNKKSTYITQAAGGIALHGDQFQYKEFLNLIEQRIQWKLRRLLQLQLTGGISRKSGNIRDLFSGALINREGVLLYGNERLNFPQSFHLRAGGTQVDLHAGRSWSVMLQYLRQMNELGQGLTLKPGSDYSHPFIVRGRQTVTYDVQAEQYVMPLKGRIRFILHGNGSLYPQLFNGSISQQIMRSVMVDLRFIHQTRGPVGGEFQFQFIKNSNDLLGKGGFPYRVEQKFIVSKVWWRCSANANLSFSYGAMKNMDTQMAHIIDMNFDANMGKRMKWAIVAQNLLHQKVYALISTDAFGITETIQPLNGRRILLQCRYLF